MLASKAIEKLLALIVRHGDHPVCLDISEDAIETIDAHPDFDEANEYIDPESVQIFLIGRE